VSGFIDCDDESLTFISSQNEENDCAAERRWENEGGNPRQSQPLPWNDQKKGGTSAAARGMMKAVPLKG
jgi:hypothetical protein